MTKIIGTKILNYPEIDSTNDEAKRLSKGGAQEGTVIIAGSQSKGRGKPGASWFSPAQVGLYLSAIVKPYKNQHDLALITQLGARAVITAVNQVTGLQGKIKLPNDVWINGKKVCGILVERTTAGYVVIGLGVNINNAAGSFPEDLQFPATSLKMETGREYSLVDFAAVLIQQLDDEYLAYLQ